MSEPEKVFLVFDKKGAVFAQCECGRSFHYFGEDADKKHDEFMRTHPCPLKPEQRTGDEVV